jgi:hypothetical protein
LGAILGIWLLRVIPQRPFDVLALSLAGIAAVRLIVACPSPIADLGSMTLLRRLFRIKRIDSELPPLI